MTSSINSLATRLKDQLFYMVLFATMFSVIGYLVPRIYYEYIDTTVYYAFHNPLSVDKPVYKPCDEITMKIDHQSLIEGQAVSIKNLLLVTNDGREIRIDSMITDVIVKKGDDCMYSLWKLPCNLVDGTYYYKGVLTFSVNGLDKTADFYTDKFTVKN